MGGELGIATASRAAAGGGAISHIGNRTPLQAAVLPDASAKLNTPRLSVALHHVGSYLVDTCHISQ